MRPVLGDAGGGRQTTEMTQWTLQCQNKYEISLTLKLALDLMTVFSSETGLDRFHVTCDL